MDGVSTGVPVLEIADVGFAYHDAVRGIDGELEGQLADGPDGDFLDGTMGDHILPVGTVEKLRIQLFHQRVKRLVESKMASIKGLDARGLVLQEEKRDIVHRERYELVTERDEERTAIVLGRL